MNRCLPRCLALGMLALPVLPAAAAEPLAGFAAERSEEQRALERRFDSALEAENLKRWMSHIASRPHHVGSEWGKQNAEFMAELFRSWGYETRIETFEVLFPTPELRRLEMTAPRQFTATLEEPTLDDASPPNQSDGALPPYNAYSVDGDVSGELVYVNYGLPEDYEELARRGVNVEGKIVIVRYGRSWRGIKPKVAAENGAVGCIIYSDPRDDGFFQGDVYPEGGFRGPHSAQRGSVSDMPLYPGDPLTPGRGATPDAERLPLDEAPTLTKIPVLPISYADARPLLEALDGPVAPPDWRGALPFEFDALVETLARYVEEVKQLADEKREQTVERNRLLDEGRHVAAADPREVYAPPPAEVPVPHLNFAPLDNALDALRQSAQSYDEALAGMDGKPLPPDLADELDAVLAGVERAMGRDEGLPGRPWYTHFVYAPGFYTGYGVKTLPAVREAIELRQWDQIEQRIEVTAEVLVALSHRIGRAAEILE